MLNRHFKKFKIYKKTFSQDEYFNEVESLSEYAETKVLINESFQSGITVNDERYYIKNVTGQCPLDIPVDCDSFTMTSVETGASYEITGKIPHFRSRGNQMYQLKEVVLCQSK